MKKGSTFKVEIRKDCKVCGGDLPTFRHRTFCSKKCRDKHTNLRWYPNQKARAQKLRGEYQEGKIKCLICKRWYRQVGSHIVQVHQMTAREYREFFDLEVKKGILTPELRDLYGRQAIENGTWKNLKKGRKYWYKKGQKGVGVYKRSHITVARLKKLHTKTKGYERNRKNK